jgi:hypothetical protein
MSYVARRPWWFPFVVEVWDTRWSEGEHWKKGHYYLEFRKGVFLRRSTALRFIEWLEANSSPAPASPS